MWDSWLIQCNCNLLNLLNACLVTLFSSLHDYVLYQVMCRLLTLTLTHTLIQTLTLTLTLILMLTHMLTLTLILENEVWWQCSNKKNVFITILTSDIVTTAQRPLYSPATSWRAWCTCPPRLSWARSASGRRTPWNWPSLVR